MKDLFNSRYMKYYMVGAVAMFALTVLPVVSGPVNDAIVKVRDAISGGKKADAK